MYRALWGMSDAKEPAPCSSRDRSLVGFADRWLCRFVRGIFICIPLQLVCQHAITGHGAGAGKCAGATGDQHVKDLGLQPVRIWQTVNLRGWLTEVCLMLAQSGCRTIQIKVGTRKPKG